MPVLSSAPSFLTLVEESVVLTCNGLLQYTWKRRCGERGKQTTTSFPFIDLIIKLILYASSVESEQRSNKGASCMPPLEFVSLYL